MVNKIRRWLPMLAIVGVCGGFFFFQEEFLNLISPKQDVTITSQDNRQVQMVTLLSKDAIPAIDNPRFLSASDADREYRDNELVIGVEINGDARAYSVPLLSGHEIVNDTVGGKPISVTW